MTDKKEIKKAPVKKVAKKVAVKKETTPKKIGRPTGFTPENKEAIYTLIKAGCSYPTAALAIGVSKHAIYTWINRGIAERNRVQAGLEPITTEVEYLDFVDFLDRKREEFVASQVLAISKAGQSGDWRASAWLLEKARPNEYGKTEQIIHTGADGGDIKVSINVGELESKIQMILAKRNKVIDEQ